MSGDLKVQKCTGARKGRDKCNILGNKYLHPSRPRRTPRVLCNEDSTVFQVSDDRTHHCWEDSQIGKIELADTHYLLGFTPRPRPDQGIVHRSWDPEHILRVVRADTWVGRPKGTPFGITVFGDAFISTINILFHVF